MNKNDMAAYIDHTLLKADATEEAVRKICHESIDFGFAAVCVNPTHVDLVAVELTNSPVKVCTVIGFPLGANNSRTKGFEAAQAVKSGADEVDMVINIGSLKSGDFGMVEEDIKEVVTRSIDQNSAAIVKVIIETCYLTDDEKVAACKIIRNAGAHFVKTSTGFGTGGAELHDVKIISEIVGNELGIKASGGISTYSKTMAMINAGATRIGTSSGVQILAEAKSGRCSSNEK